MMSCDCLKIFNSIFFSSFFFIIHSFPFRPLLRSTPCSPLLSSLSFSGFPNADIYLRKPVLRYFIFLCMDSVSRLDRLFLAPERRCFTHRRKKNVQCPSHILAFLILFLPPIPLLLSNSLSCAPRQSYFPSTAPEYCTIFSTTTLRCESEKKEPRGKQQKRRVILCKKNLFSFSQGEKMPSFRNDDEPTASDKQSFFFSFANVVVADSSSREAATAALLRSQKCQHIYHTVRKFGKIREKNFKFNEEKERMFPHEN